MSSSLRLSISATNTVDVIRGFHSLLQRSNDKAKSNVQSAFQRAELFAAPIAVEILTLRRQIVAESGKSCPKKSENRYPDARGMLSQKILSLPPYRFKNRSGASAINIYKALYGMHNLFNLRGRRSQRM